MLLQNSRILFVPFLLCLCFANPEKAALAQDAAKEKDQSGSAVAPTLPFYPVDLCVAEDGTVYVVDVNLHGVWRWKEGKLDVLFEGSPKFRTPLNAPRCIAIDKDGSVLVGDSATREVYRLKEDAAPEPITGGKIGIPMDLAVSEDGTIYVADLESRRLFRIPPDFNSEADSVEEVAFINPRGVTVDQSGEVWVVSQDPRQLQKVSSEGKSESVISKRTFRFPHQVAVDGEGVAYVSDGYGKAIWKVTGIDAAEKIVEGQPLDNPVGVTWAADTLWIVDPRVRKVFRLADGNELEEVFELKR
ncbi:MAG: NHL repeat-containing protein [Pirellulaceae bacterium]